MALTVQEREQQNEDARIWWNEHRGILIAAIANLPLLSSSTNINHELVINSGFIPVSHVCTSPLWVHPNINNHLLSRADVRLFIRGLTYAVSIGDFEVAKHVYVWCKHWEIRRESEHSLDRYDTFFCGISSDTLLFRHQGTRDGQIKANQISDPSYAIKNKTLLRVLQHGPSSPSGLICSASGNPVDDVDTWLPTEGRYIKTHRFELHHSKYENNTSYYYDVPTKQLTVKTVEPSVYMHKWIYPQYDTGIVMELLSTIILDSGEHGAYHKLPMKSSGINHWIDAPPGVYKCIPYAWQSSRKYNAVIKWIVANCPKVDIGLIPKYKDFIKLHST